LVKESHTLNTKATHLAVTFANQTPEQGGGSGGMVDSPRNSHPMLQLVLILDFPLQGVPQLLLDWMLQLAKLTPLVLKDPFCHYGMEPELVVPSQAGHLVDS
jgi:hypothetical protein